MTKYILHGGFSRKDNESNRAFFAELVRDVPDGGTVLLVYFASESGDDINRRFTNHQQQIMSQVNGKSLQFVLADERDFIAQVQKAHAVYFNGGSTPKLLTTLEQFPNLNEQFIDKTVAGSSAGAYVLATYGAAHSGEHIRKGLGLVPVRVACHFESPELPPSPTSLEEIGKTATELELVFLRDYEWRVFEI